MKLFGPLLLPTLLVLPGCREAALSPPPPELVRFVRAESVDKQRPGSSYIGIVRGDVETDLSFKVGGVLELIGPSGKPDWEEGARIDKGAVLARLKQEQFTNDVNIARVKADLDRKQLERGDKLLGTGAISQQDFDVFTAEKRSSETRLAQAQQALQDSILVSPIQGTILSRFANAGETVAAGKPVLRIANLDKMSVEIGVPDRLVSQFQVGKTIPVSISALEGAHPVTGEVSEVGVAAKSDARLFRVLIKVPNPDGRLKSGMTASVPVGNTRPAAGNEVAVPVSALVARNNKDKARPLAVFVIEENGQAREQPVETGDFIGSSVTIRHGLQPGQKVVVVGASTLYDGAKVDAREATSLQRY